MSPAGAGSGSAAPSPALPRQDIGEPAVTIAALASRQDRRLAQVISERKVQGGLRRVLLTQAKRLQWLSTRRYEALGGAASVPVEAEGEDI